MEVRQRISLQVWNAFNRVCSETKNFEISEKIFQDSVKVFQIIQQSYHEGIASVVELTDNQKKLLEAEQQHIKKIYALKKAELALMFRSGNLRAYLENFLEKTPDNTRELSLLSRENGTPSIREG